MINARTEALAQTYEPVLSVVVYKSGPGRDEFYLESHDINKEGQLMAGRPVMQETLQGIVDVFFDERKNASRISGFIDENLLSFELLPGAHYNMLWYRAPEQRFLHFAKQLKIDSGNAWVPGMIYLVKRNSLDVFAYKGSGRPKMNTKLFRGPYHNVSDDGSVCLGNARVKKPTEKTYQATMKYWEDLFWLSEFTHTNGDNPTKSDVSTVWRRLVGKNKRLKWADIDELVEMKNKTVKNLLK